MNNSVLKAIALLISLVVLAANSQIASAQQYKKIKRLGTSQAICSGGVETVAQLQEFFANNPGKIRSILANSGWTGSADDLLAAVANGDMTERAYPVGTQMAWMGAKVNGQYVANPYREWAGSKSFEAFQINLSSGCQVYHIAIPKACCNVALMSVEEDQSSECQAPPVAAVAPVAESAALTADPDAGKKAHGLIPFFGMFAGSETRPRYEPAWDMDMKDASGVVGGRIGLMKEISAKTSFFGQLSYFDRNSVSDGNVYPDDNFALDFGFDRKLSDKAFIGGGVGAWNVDNSDFRDASLFGHVGANIGESDMQWYLEGRVFDSNSRNHSSISDNKMFSAGIRYLIK